MRFMVRSSVDLPQPDVTDQGGDLLLAKARGQAVQGLVFLQKKSSLMSIFAVPSNPLDEGSVGLGCGLTFMNGGSPGGYGR